jgi:short-subunit dehydrogenase
MSNPAVLITGASSGIGAVYADRFAHRGHDVILVARDIGRLWSLSERLRRETGVHAEVLHADLTNDADLAKVERRLAEDDRIGVLINNAGASLPGTFADQSPDTVATLIRLNVTAVPPGRRRHAAVRSGG